MRLPTTTTATSAAVRSLLRETAQSVTVVTALKNIDGANTVESSTDKNPITELYGATLSSFTSVALDPYPIVAFALRKPSRMASCLKDSSRRIGPQLVINLLSSDQAETAVRFSRPDLYPEPFSSSTYRLSHDGLPIIANTLGAFVCRLISWHSLDDLSDSEDDVAKTDSKKYNHVSSELFLARVLTLEPANAPIDGLPLLYHRRQYTTVMKPPQETL